MNNEMNMNAVETVENTENTAIVATTQEEVAMNNTIINAPQEETAVVEVPQDEVTNAPQEEEFIPVEGDENPEIPEEEEKESGMTVVNGDDVEDKYSYVFDGPLAINPNTWSVKQVVSMIDNGTIKMDNPIQRGYKWEVERSSYLIHSMLYGFPVPVFWANKIRVPSMVGKKKKDISVYDILDGKQRLTSIANFVKGKFALKNVPPIMLEDGTLVSLEGVAFKGLTADLQTTLLSYPLVIKSCDDMTDGQKRELFKRLNNGKPLSSKELNIANCRNIGTVADLARHQLWDTILTEKAKESRKAVTLVVKAYEMLTKDLATVSFESKNFNPVMESVNLSDAEKEMLSGVLDYALMVYNSFDDSIKGAKKKFITEVHLVSLMPFLKRAKDEGLEPKLVADFVVANYSKRTSISERYTTASRDGSARTASIGIRNEEIAEAWAKFFTTDDATEGTETEIVDNNEYHVYGMRLRGFAPGCQPMTGLVEGKDDPSGKYHSILVYSRELSAEEVEEYELDII